MIVKNWKSKSKRNKRTKRAAVKNSQAVVGRRVKKRDVEKISSRLKEILVYVWKPKLISVCVVFLLMIFSYKNIELDNLFPIQSVKIEGEFDFLDKNQLRDQAIPVVKGGFFNVNLPAVRNALVNLPWVEDVSVRRLWPDQLLVRVIEKQPVVLWGNDGVISSKGKLFTPLKKPTIELPHLTGPQGQHKVMLQELARMQAWLLETGLYIKSVDLNARRSWTLIMTSGMELRLGRKQMHERLDRFVSVYKETLEVEKREIKHIDMRYTNGFAVAWKEA
ncbi:MAG: cell division protein FtsQ/DivIB [Gammaproteobacteria bacterium]|nr:cell division protein FtsQ/DivIB [Gammaproteobacteria bacterium]